MTYLGFSILAAGAIGLTAVPASAQPNTQLASAATVNAAAPAAAKAKADEKVCRNLKITGSRMAKNRVCLTKDDWKKVDEDR